MSANFGSSNSQDVDLNITPIIDCFTVLITFLLASASFLSIGFFEASTAGVAGESTPTEPEIEAVLKVNPNRTAELKVKGKANYTVSFNFTDPAGLNKLDDELKRIQDSKYKVNQVLLSAEDSVDYKSISEVMDHIAKSQLPVVVGEF